MAASVAERRVVKHFPFQALATSLRLPHDSSLRREGHGESEDPSGSSLNKEGHTESGAPEPEAVLEVPPPPTLSDEELKIIAKSVTRRLLPRTV